MTLVVGTAGHIDHGKTSLLRALTGIDADRLPEERRRGMTIDVGYAHFRLEDGTEIDFVDVPGHDRLIGNMLVGAGEIDAALVVVAADDGPRAQTIEHLELLDALGIEPGLAVVTKTDAVSATRIAEVVDAVRELLDRTSLRGAPVLGASSLSGVGIDAIRSELARLARVHAGMVHVGPPRLAIDRVFSVRGRGVVATGSHRGRTLTKGDVLRVEPMGRDARVRELQIHNRPVERIADGGRVAVNLAGVETSELRRGLVLTSGPGVERTDRMLVLLRPTDGEAGAGPSGLRHGQRVRLHLGTEQVDGTLDLSRRASVAIDDGRLTAIVRLDRPLAAAFGDRFVMRRPSPGRTLAGGQVLDPVPPRGISRRRVTAQGLGRLAAAPTGSIVQREALVALHGALPAARIEAWSGVGGESADPASTREPAILAPDVAEAIEATALQAARSSGGAPVADVRTALAGELRRRVSLDRTVAAAVVEGVMDGLVGRGDLVRDGQRLVLKGASLGPDRDLLAAMDRLEALLAVPAPPPLGEAAASAQCSLAGIRALESAGRIVRVEDDLAWASSTIRQLEELAMDLASRGPLSPAALRDATGTSRRYALAILEDLDRRAVLRRTPAGHVPGPRAASLAAAGTRP